MPGTVVHCKRDEHDVYIGRGGRWGNPFSHREGTRAQFVVGSRDEAISAYRGWLWAEVRAGRIGVAQLATLHGKRLGCWCAPQPCHGEVLVQAAAWAHEQIAQARHTGDTTDVSYWADLDAQVS